MSTPQRPHVFLATPDLRGPAHDLSEVSSAASHPSTCPFANPLRMPRCLAHPLWTGQTSRSASGGSPNRHAGFVPDAVGLCEKAGRIAGAVFRSASRAAVSSPSWIRFFDAAIGAWRSTGIDLVNGDVRRFVVRAEGDEILMLSDEEEPQLRWRSTAIAPDAPHARAVRGRRNRAVRRSRGGGSTALARDVPGGPGRAI